MWTVVIVLALATLVAYARHSNGVQIFAGGPLFTSDKLRWGEAFALIVVLNGLTWYRSPEVYRFAFGRPWFWMINIAMIILWQKLGDKWLKKAVFVSLVSSIIVGAYSDFKSACSSSGQACPVAMSMTSGGDVNTAEVNRAIAARAELDFAYRMENSKTMRASKSGFVINRVMASRELVDQLYHTPEGWCQTIRPRDPRMSYVTVVWKDDGTKVRYLTKPNRKPPNMGQVAIFSFEPFGNPAELEIITYPETYNRDCDHSSVPPRA